MSLRITPTTIHTARGAAVRRCSSSSVPVHISCCSSSTKQTSTSGRVATPTTKTTSFPKLHVAEQLATRLGLEMAAADLERLFRSGTPPGELSRPLRVAYQGARGSYCQEAAAAAFPSASGQPCSQMEAAFAALEDGCADRAVIPIENSLDGPIPRNLDLLLRHPAVSIAGELLLPVNHCLLSLPTASPSSIRRVVSHPQALAHCSAALRRLGLPAEDASCAADAARMVAEGQLEDVAVIGSRMAAKEYGLRVVEENIQDKEQCRNITRFLQLQSTPQVAFASGKQMKRVKATVAFSLDKGPSDMFQAMWAMESRGVRVTRVDHRPNRDMPIRAVAMESSSKEKVNYMDYVFVLDVEGEAEAIERGVKRLEEIAGFVRVLGSYTAITA